ncbi:MAG: transposase [Candidatus Omnitrophota bacterium]|nr:transposase [Candidatus Omnitrophota bacterium]
MADVIDLIEQGKVKRYFRARSKSCFDGAISHITQHASGTEPLFLEESDYIYMIHLMKETLNRFGAKVLSFLLMPNHFHLLCKFLEANMPDAMKDLFQKYAMYFNKKYARRGHVFSGAYRSALCFDEKYLITASLYIHHNPVEAELVKNAVDYRWSSCALFLNDINKDTFVDYKFILQILDSDINQARLKYKNLLNKFAIKKMGDVFEQPDGLEMAARSLRQKDGVWFIEHEAYSDFDIDRKIQEMKEKGNFRGPQARYSRRFLIEQLKSRGFRVLDIANRLGLSRQTVSTYLNV